MEKNDKKKCRLPAGKKTGWPLGVLLLLSLAAGIRFGMHTYYAPAAWIMLALTVLVCIFRRYWWSITSAALIGMTAFLLTFSPLGYTYMAAVTALAAVLLTILRFGGKRLRKTVGLLFLAGCIILGAVEAPIVANARTDADPKRDYLIVLGASVYGTRPSVSLENRLKSALSYLNTYPESKAVLSGGQGAGEDITEAECMRQWLEKNGVAPERLLLEDASSSTYENLAYSKAMIEKDGGNPSSVAIVSNTYHLYRAKLIAASLGMEAAGVAGIPGLKLYMCGMFLREAVAVAHFRLLGT